ncbi:MAG TPA: RecX family transcriptional regulator [Gaiellales bacterium]|jgi:regulatory protein
MTTIVGLRRTRAGGPTVEVVLDSGERLRVHDRRLGEHGLCTGTTLAPATYEALQTAGRLDTAERRALRLIAVRPRSRSELRRRLGEWGLGETDSAAVLERLAAIGLVDDDALAAAVVSIRRADAYGRLRVGFDLDRLGIDEETGAGHTATSAADELDRARRALRGRHAPDARDPASLRRAAAFLARRGFDADTVAAALGHELDA